MAGAADEHAHPQVLGGLDVGRQVAHVVGLSIGSTLSAHDGVAGRSDRSALGEVACVSDTFTPMPEDITRPAPLDGVLSQARLHA